MDFKDVMQYLFARSPRTVGHMPAICNFDTLRAHSPNFANDPDDDLATEPVCNQHTLAAALGVSLRTIRYAYDNRVSVETAAKLANLYGIPAEFFRCTRSLQDLQEQVDRNDAKARPVISWNQISRTVDDRLQVFVQSDKRLTNDRLSISPMFGSERASPKGLHDIPQMANDASPCLQLRISDEFPARHLREGKRTLYALVVLEGPRGEQIIANDPASHTNGKTTIAPYLVNTLYLLPPDIRWYWHKNDELGGGKWNFFVLLSSEPIDPDILTIGGRSMAEGQITEADLDRIATWAAARRGDTVVFAHATCMVVAK